MYERGINYTFFSSTLLILNEIPLLHSLTPSLLPLADRNCSLSHMFVRFIYLDLFLSISAIWIIFKVFECVKHIENGNMTEINHSSFISYLISLKSENFVRRWHLFFPRFLDLIGQSRHYLNQHRKNRRNWSLMNRLNYLW